MPRISTRESNYEIFASSDVFRKFIYNLPEHIQSEIHYGNYSKVDEYFQNYKNKDVFKDFGIEDITIEENYKKLLEDMTLYGF